MTWAWSIAGTQGCQGEQSCEMWRGLGPRVGPKGRGPFRHRGWQALARLPWGAVLFFPRTGHLPLLSPPFSLWTVQGWEPLLSSALSHRPPFLAEASFESFQDPQTLLEPRPSQSWLPQWAPPASVTGPCASCSWDRLLLSL